MSDPQQIDRNVSRSTQANIYLVLLLTLTLGVPLACIALRQRKADQLAELSVNGQLTTASVTASSLIVRNNSVRYEYQFIANGRVYRDSERLTLKPNFFGEQTTLPVIFSPADPENHIVAESVTAEDIDSRLFTYTLGSFIGPVAALLAVWMEVGVYRQMKLARRGKLIKAAVTNFELCSKGRQFQIDYRFTTPDGIEGGGSFRLARMAAAGILPRGPVSIVYHPAKPGFNLPLMEMWAVKWPQAAPARTTVAAA